MSSSPTAAAATDMALDLKGLLGALKRSLVWLLPLVVAVAATVFILLSLSPKKYLGEARVLIQSTDYGLLGVSRGVEEERALLDEQGVASQVQLLVSADLARRVVNRLDLIDVPEFEAEEESDIVNSVLGMIGLGAKKERTATKDERVLKSYFKKLNVYRLEGSRVIAVEFTSEDPELAAKVANTILDEYLALQSAAKRQSTEVATLSLQPQIVQLRQELQKARQAVAEFRSKADLLLGSGNQTLNQQQLVELGTSYNNALAARDEAQAKATQVKALLKSGGALETASDVLNSQLIQRLRERQAELQANLSELSITLLPNHPQLKAIKSQLADYDRLIRSEAEKILAGLESDARVAAQQADALGARLEDLKKQVTRSNADQVRLDELEREATSKEQQLDGLVASYREADTRLKAQVLPADARIISRAIVPVEPYAPKVIATTILAAVATFVFGCALVVAWAFLSGTALYPVQAAGAAEEPWDGRERRRARPQADFTPASGGYVYEGYSPVAARYVSDMAMDERKPEALEAPEEREPEARHDDAAADDQTSTDGETKENAAPELAVVAAGTDEKQDTPEETEASADQPEETTEAIPVAASPEKSNKEAEEALVRDLDGVIVVLSVDSPRLSSKCAFHLAREAADRGNTSLLLEVYPEIRDADAAKGFAELVAGEASFSKVIYGDSGSKAHIIEAGAKTIPDEMARDPRFTQTLEVIVGMYNTVVIDLGAIDGSLASVQILRRAERVLLMSEDEELGPELEGAAKLLRRNSRAQVEVFAEGDLPASLRKGADHAA